MEISEKEMRKHNLKRLMGFVHTIKGWVEDDRKEAAIGSLSDLYTEFEYELERLQAEELKYVWVIDEYLQMCTYSYKIIEDEKFGGMRLVEVIEFDPSGSPNPAYRLSENGDGKVYNQLSGELVWEHEEDRG